MAKFIKSFKDIINEYAKESGDIELLPLCHTTTEGFLLSIINSKSLISKKACRYYNEYLVYFFYGKSSYLVGDEAENYTQDPPITLIYDINNLAAAQIKRLLPFDSGGYDRYSMRQGFERDIYTYDKADLDILKGMIKLIYQTNDNYLHNQVSFEELSKHTDVCREIIEIINLYNRIQNGQLRSGQQVHSIEIQFEEKLDAEPKYIILPYNFFMSKFWGQNFRQEFPDIIVDHYGQKEILNNPGQVLSGSDYMRLMKQKVMEMVK